MAKTQQQYYDELYATGKKSLDKQHKTWKETDAATLKQINAGIDKAAKTAAGQYEQRIEAAPLESRALYDQNAVADAVAKKQVQERLANMGVTDSGLNASMQTAMAIQKQKADARVRADEAAKIQAIQNTIDKILSDAEIDKNEQKMQLERNTADRYNAALQNLETSSRQAAATSYAADQDYLARQYEADQEATTAQAKIDNDNYWKQMQYELDSGEARKKREQTIHTVESSLAKENEGWVDENNSTFTVTVGGVDKVYPSYQEYLLQTIGALYDEGKIPDEDAVNEILDWAEQNLNGGQPLES